MMIRVYNGGYAPVFFELISKFVYRDALCYIIIVNVYRQKWNN